MLRFLSVRHLAVIERLDVEFEPGLTVLTGETGAGKSVLVEAIDLLLGGRASADLVRTGEKQAAVQAIFERPGGPDVIVRRDVSAQGRSRAFIDDSLATTAALRDLALSLIDLHGQHEHQQLLDPAEHVALLDAFAGLAGPVGALARRYDDWRAARAALDRTRLDDREKQARLDLARFQLHEIDKVGPRSGEDVELTTERLVLASADRLSRLTGEALDALYEGESSVLATLAGVWKRLTELTALDARFAPYIADRDDIRSRLEDLALFLRDYRAGLDGSPDRLQTVEDRLAALERLRRRFGPDLADVLARRHSLSEEIASLDASEELASRLEAEERAAREQFVSLAREVSGSRHDAASRLGAALAADLAELAMPRAVVDVRVSALDQDAWHRRGVDAVEIYISPNPGEELRPLARVASGGELSRIMLALRSIGRSEDPGRTLVFDEVDAGIGGEAADAVGARLQALARRYQVVCVTHLPQIAARASSHLQVSKHVRGARTITTVNALDDAGRELELARMIAGAEVTPSVLASAQEMMRLRRDSEHNTKAKVIPTGPLVQAKAKGRRHA